MLQKLLKYFSGTAIFKIFNTPLLAAAAGFSKVLDLYLNHDELFIDTLSGFPALFIEDSSPLNCHKHSDVFI